jgi:hypothetical protein
MSALPPKADIETQSRDVRFVPKADISQPPADCCFPALAFALGFGAGYAVRERKSRMPLRRYYHADTAD